ncbi:MAG: AAA family ATPase [Bacillota bacterium]|nr:AAA family ATPase [Bacillota bacterium]
MGKWVKEIALGGALALLVLAVILGFDLTVFLFPLSIAALGAMVVSSRGGLGPRFSTASLATGESSAVPAVTFSDIGGQETAKREFLEALTFLKDSVRTRQLGIRPLKGVLLVGPPGTGKTLMAKAAANYTGSAFVAASGSQFVQMYAGVGAGRVRQLFKQARALAERQSKTSAIVFIDEIEVLGPKRGKNTSHMEYDQTLNELLTQMDGVESEHKVQVLVVGATNRADLLDPALLRPGRFDRIVQVDLPDKAGRLHILKIHAASKPLADDVSLETVAAETHGFSGAHLESLLNEAAICALRDGRSEINQSDLRDATEKVMLGERSSRTLSKEERQRVAYHEVGHAVISELVRPGSVASITIVSRNRALGFIRQSQDDQYLYTKDQLLQAIQVYVAGAVMEEMVFGQRSTGAANDIEQAVDLAKRMVFSGLSPLGIVSPDLPAAELSTTIAQIIKEQEEAVEVRLTGRKQEIEAITRRLLEEESMGGEDFRALLQRKRVS